MNIHVRKPGIFTTVQGLGRSVHRSLGINPGGAMDRTAVRLINTLIGNDENSAVLEMHFPAAEIVFESDVVFAIGGANFAAALDKRRVENWRCIRAKAGSTLRFCDRIKGNRAYLAIAGGIKFERPLGGPSAHIESATHFEIFETEPRKTIGEHARVSTSLVPIYSRFPTVRVLDGPEAYLLTEKSTEHLFSEMFTVLRESNRMGFRLEGEPLSLTSEFQMISSAVTFGTIQLLPNGQMITLMADHQTSGGYPRIGQIASFDLPLMAQLGAGDKISFNKITVGEAEDLAMQFERDLALMKLGIRLRT